MVAVLIASLFTAPASFAQEAGQTLDTVLVTGSGIPAYKTDTAAVGPLASKPLVDTPYAVSVVPNELLENQQLKSVREAFRYLPSVQGENIRPQTRGLQAGVVQNTRIDGMNIAATTDYPIEQFDRIEVLNGLAGALYGPSNPAGTFNYVLKRPTTRPLHRLSLGYTSKGQSSLNADLSDRFGEGQRYGYRINLLGEGGESYVKGSDLDRRFASLAFDVNLTRDTSLETNISRYRYTSEGLPGIFALASNAVRFPAAPDPSCPGYGQLFAGDDNLTKTYSARLKHRFNDDWSLTAGILKQSSDRVSTVPANTLNNNAGSYTVRVVNTTFTLDDVVSHIIALNGRVKTGDVTHDLVVSATGFDWDRSRPYAIAPITLGTSSLANPALYPAPVLPDFKSRYVAQTVRQESLTVGDTATFNEQWSAGLFISQSWIRQHGWTAAGAPIAASEYDDDGLSANATLSYKPRKNMTVYGSYADSLQQGEASGTTILAPYRSKQWELGYKAELGPVGVGAALFRVERPYAYDVGGVFATRGKQRNQGVELTVNGALSRDLTVYGGLTYLDPTLHNTGNASTEGKKIMGLPQWMASMLFDYRIAAVPGLAFNLNLQELDGRYGDHANTYKVPGYTLADAGARYSSRLWRHPVTWRLTVSNLTNKQYWANITPAGQNGYTGGGAGNATLGTPRLVRLSMQVDF